MNIKVGDLVRHVKDRTYKHYGVGLVISVSIEYEDFEVLWFAPPDSSGRGPTVLYDESDLKYRYLEKI